MSNKELETKDRIIHLKSMLANYERVECVSEDLEDTVFNTELYSNDLFLYRSSTDKFIYLYDSKDDSEAKLTIIDLKIILESIASREIEEKYELDELEFFLSSEENE